AAVIVIRHPSQTTDSVASLSTLHSVRKPYTESAHHCTRRHTYEGLRLAKWRNLVIYTEEQYGLMLSGVYGFQKRHHEHYTCYTVSSSSIVDDHLGPGIERIGLVSYYGNGFAIPEPVWWPRQ
ncbi:hypothetical protein U1Q18_050483, partial [Sarracenia purpurea var. burkii]